MSKGDIPLSEIEIPQIEEYPADHSVLLHGPPGTGKTTTAAGRVAHLILDHGYDISDVAWLTYRRSLAVETLERLSRWALVDEEELDDPAEGATRYISTVHAVANRAVGGLPDPVEDWHPAAFCKAQNIRWDSSTVWGTSPGEELFDCFEWMIENCYDPAEPADLAHYPNLDDLRSVFEGDVARVWAAWNDYKDEKGRIDFHEQLQGALDTGSAPNTPILVIDEYHDATPLMARVCEMWMDRAEIVIVAGDPHQVVNNYQGADPYFFEKLEERYPKILLDKSWRLGDSLWRGAARQLAPAHDPPGVETTGSGELIEYESPSFEYSTRTHKWTTPPTTAPASPAWFVDQYSDDLVFLTRTKQQADGVGAQLEKAGVIYRSQGELGGWNTDRGSTRLELFNALNKIRGVSPDAFESPDESLTAFGGSAPIEDTELTAEETATLLGHTPAEHLAQSRGDTRRFCTEIEGAGVPQPLVEVDEYVEPSFWGVFTHGAPAVRKLLQGNLGSGREREALQNALKARSTPVDPEEVKVRVMTVHASKGHEAGDVVVYDGITKTINEAIRTDDAAWRNECRVWYVALSRASERLHLVHDAFEWITPYVGRGLRHHVRPTAGGSQGVSSDD